jgi:putative membrane protein
MPLLPLLVIGYPLLGDADPLLPSRDVGHCDWQLAGQDRPGWQHRLLAIALSMISFGFTVYKFFQIENRSAAGANRLLGPREFALILIGTGLIALALSALQHRQGMQRLRAESDDITVPVSIATIVAGLVSVLGLLAFLAVLFRG